MCDPDLQDIDFLHRFTISTWIFIFEPCLDGLCGILNHRSTSLLTPLLSITSSGKWLICRMILLYVLVMGLYILRILEGGRGDAGACPDLAVYVLESWCGCCYVFFGKTLHFHGASFHSEIYKQVAQACWLKITWKNEDDLGLDWCPVQEDSVVKNLYMCKHYSG